MEEIKNIIDDLGNSSLENSINLAGVAVISDSGNPIYQTSNFDISKQTNIILSVLNGERSFVLSELNFNVIEATAEGTIATNDGAMGHILLVPFKGGVLVAYAMPNANPPKALSFLKVYAMRLERKIILTDSI